MCDQHARSAIFQVDAGRHNRRKAIVSASCPASGCGCNCRGDHGHVMWELDDKGERVRQVPVQCVEENGSWRVYWIVDELAAGQVRRYELSVGEGEHEGGVSIDYKAGQQADFLIDGQLFTRYVIAPDVARPYCYPVHGPGGYEVTNFAPSDHVHHKSMYVAQGDINGQDNWSELEGHARTVNTSLQVRAQGPLLGCIDVTNDWVSAKGEKLMQELTRIVVYNCGPEMRVMDWIITWRAAYQGVHIGDTKEAGTLSVRVAESMEERNGGCIVNAYGAISEAECWGKRAPWVDYYGPVADEILGIAIFDHPTNFRHPTYWHVRAYGLFTANEWGIHDFTGDWSKRGDFAMPLGSQLTFRFRVYIHRGDTASADVAGRYLDFAYPPAVEEVEQ